PRRLPTPSSSSGPWRNERGAEVYFVESDKFGGWWLLDESRLKVGVMRVEADAREIVAALNLVEGLRREFPGLWADEMATDYQDEVDVNGGDLVEFLSTAIAIGADGS